MKKFFSSHIKRAEKKLGIDFENKELLLNALTHTSYLAEKPSGLVTNERMEFLGDAVLGFIVTKEIYNRLPHLSEGDLAKLRARIVKAETLAKIGKDLKIGEDIIMGKGTEAAGGRTTKSILENTLEAIIGAIYLDRGLEVVEGFILKKFSKTIEIKSKLKDYTDAKTALQEKAVEIIGKRPLYLIIKECGPLHDKTFVSQVKLDGKVYGTGEGKSKKKAEQQAAMVALEKLKKIFNKGDS